MFNLEAFFSTSCLTSPEIDCSDPSCEMFPSATRRKYDTWITKDAKLFKGSLAFICDVIEQRSRVCAMVLANGQHMFTSNPAGEYTLDVPLDDYGEITLYVFCSGLAPFEATLTAYCANDADRDGICDHADNCHNISNPGQEDADHDGIGNACDGDVPIISFQVAAGAYHTVGLKTDGTVVAVGYNTDGQCNVDDWN